jgi:hypothetical protein
MPVSFGINKLNLDQIKNNDIEKENEESNKVA